MSFKVHKGGAEASIYQTLNGFIVLQQKELDLNDPTDAAFYDKYFGSLQNFPPTVTTVSTLRTQGYHVVTSDGPCQPKVTKVVPASAAIGDSITITGVDLATTTKVKFTPNVLADFDTVSNTKLRVTVPASATSGIIQVITPTVTVSTSSPFTIK